MTHPSRRDILRLILGRGASTLAVGLAAGAIVTASLAGLLRSLLFGVGAGDPAIVVASAAFLVIVALAACLGPAARASRIAPADAIRAD
jgi:ABC-type antimicrobial peptide transport system permease subunit